MDKYQAVNAESLVRILGNGCSPMPSRRGYVIGPDVDGRICHIATCFSLYEAQQRAKQLNKNG